MSITIQELVDRLTSQEPMIDWPPEEPPRPLRSFADLPDIPPQELECLSQLDEIADPLRLRVDYQNKEYKPIHTFFKNDPNQLGNEGKLLLVLAYLQLFRDNPNKLERHAAPLVEELAASEQSEFALLYEWFQNFVQERPMPQAFDARSSGCPGIDPIPVVSESSPALPPPNVIEKSKPDPATTLQPEPEPAPALQPKPAAQSTPDVLTLTSPIHLELVRVTAGEFLMGSDPAKDKHAADSEQPQHRVHVSEFYIGRAPVTNAQYAAFVKAIKHKAPEHWKNGEIPSNEETHPVVYVSWLDAVAFCRWLSQKSDKDFRLPTEAEWEKAARGTDGRIYPWGDTPPMAKLCNFGKVGVSVPVGQYSPQGNSPYGCTDMAGTVWEWTQSLWGKDLKTPEFGYPYNPADGRENLDAEDKVCRVLRGGAFHHSQGGMRCAYRNHWYPCLRLSYNGFRVVTTVPFSFPSAP